MHSIKESNRIVIKVGTSTLTHTTGRLNIRTVEKLVKVIADLKNMGKEIIIVTSGAVGVGMSKAGFYKKPDEIAKKQALAAIGQCELMNYYGRLFEDYHHTVAQILLTKDVIEDEKRYQNAKTSLKTLLDLSVIPVVNENDVISTEQLEFGDNDTLSAYVSVLTDADLLVILSDIDGLYDKDPRENKDAKIIDVVDDITDEIKKCAGKEGSNRGTGGMITKITAASIATQKGIDMIIANGKDPSILYDIFDGKKCGTLFVGRGDKK